MSRKITFKRIIVSGLVMYLFLAVYFLLSLISSENVIVNKYGASDMENNLESMESLEVTQKDVPDAESEKYRINFRSNLEKFENQKKIEGKKTPKPTKPPRWVKHAKNRDLERFRMPSTVNQNFSEIAPNVLVYSAFLDDRYNSTFIRLTVIAPRDRKKQASGIYCVFPNGEMTELVYYETCENHLKHNAFYTMSCIVPSSEVHRFNGITPLTIAPSKGSNPDRYKFISVINNIGINRATGRTVMRKYAVCVPPLFGNVNVLRIVEFIELTKLLGSTHFTFYTSNISDDIMRVLNYYVTLGTVTILPWFIPTDNIWYKGQSAAVGDCLLRNMHIHELVAFNDIDEFIVPHFSDSWEGLVNSAREQTTLNGRKSENIAVYRFKSAFFEKPRIQTTEELTRAEKYHLSIMDKFASLSFTQRTRIFSRIRTKMLVYPLKVFELGIHHLSKQLREEYFCLDVEPETGFLHHYRKCDYTYGMSCSQFVEDTTALQFQLALINNTIRVLNELKYTTNTNSTM